MQDGNLNPPSEAGAPPLPSERLREEEISAEVISGGSLAEAICGIGAIVLAIVALAGTLPVHLSAIAAIVLGGGLLLEGAAIGARFGKLLGEIVGPRFSMAELGGGMTAEFFAGAAGIVLGILALVGIVSVTLLSVAAIVFGAALLLGAGATSSLNALIVEHRYRAHEVVRRVAGTMVSGTAGAQVLVGLSAIILGIVALTDVHPLTLSLVAFLAVGAAVGVSGLALCTKMLEMLRRSGGGGMGGGTPGTGHRLCHLPADLPHRVIGPRRTPAAGPAALQPRHEPQGAQAGSQASRRSRRPGLDGGPGRAGLARAARRGHAGRGRTGRVGGAGEEFGGAAVLARRRVSGHRDPALGLRHGGRLPHGLAAAVMPRLSIHK
jgi:hypothetical protein